MRKLIILLVTVCIIAVPANAMDFTAPPAPESALEYLPSEIDSFGDGLRFVIISAISSLNPDIKEAAGVCATLIGISLLVGLLGEIAGNMKPVVELTGSIVVAISLFQPMKSLIRMGAQTVTQVSQYGKLILPVMTGALAAEGGITKSGSLYAVTAFFDACISEGIASILTPIIYLYLCICVTVNLFPEAILKNVKNLIKWLISWLLKTILYLFTGFISITGVVGGATDATVLKATKLTISGMVPVVGGILSDASEAVLVSAGIMKNAAGIYGLLTVIAIWIGPFLRIGVQYLMLKVTSGTCEIFGAKQMTEIMKDFSCAMGFLLAMTGAVCMIFIISTICFMKGVS